MASAKWFDRYQSTLASGYTSGGTSLSVTSAGSGASALPASGDFWVLVEAEGSNTEEVFKATAISGTTLTVAGAQAGTTASNHASGAVIRGAIMTADSIVQLKTDAAGAATITSMTAASFNTATSNGTANPSGYQMVIISDEDTVAMWTGALWRYDTGPFVPAGGGILLADYTWTNQGTATATQRSAVAGGVIMNIPAVSGSNWRILKRNIPGSTPWTITMSFVAERAGNMRAGLVLIDTGGKLVSWGASSDTSRSLDNWNSVTSFSSGGNPFTWTAGQTLSVQIKHTGTNLEYYKKLATDSSFSLIVTTSATAWLGTLASYGFGVDGENNVATDTFLTMAVT